MIRRLIEALPIQWQEGLEYLLVPDPHRKQREAMSDEERDSLSDKGYSEWLQSAEKNRKLSRWRMSKPESQKLFASLTYLAERGLPLLDWQDYHQTDASGFEIGGVNPTERIKQLTHLNEQSIRRIEFRMRKDIRGMDARTIKWFNYYGSNMGGFLDDYERLLHVLERDNNFVLSLGLTHQGLARHLFYVMNLCWLKEIWRDKSPFEVKEEGGIGLRGRLRVPFIYKGERYLALPGSWSMGQGSPFFDDTGTYCGFTVFNIDRKEGIDFSGLVPIMIYRYGFYEGNVHFRVDPKHITSTFGLRNEPTYSKS